MSHEQRSNATDEITSQSANSLGRLIARGDVSAVDVADAHIRRIEQTADDLNAVVVPRFDQALDAARRFDEDRRRRDSPGPLAGVPITVKEMFDVVGTPTTAGLTALSTHRADSDATVVARLRRAGAIILGKTNVSQLGIMPETDNPLYGRTNNPWNLERSPGGSSGGESAIIAAGGSPLGLGSDSGGSVRQPANSCGICSIKPTSGRLPLDGHFASANWFESWPQPGPLARSVDDLEIALSVLAGDDPRGRGPGDAPSLIADPREIDSRSLRVGFYTDLEGVTSSPAVRRAVREAAAVLDDAGATVEEFELPDAERAWLLYAALFYADGMLDMRRQTRGSRLDWRLKEHFSYTRLPGWARRLLARYYALRGQQSTAKVLRTVSRPVLTTAEFLDLVAAQRAYQRSFAAALDAAGLDVLIAPVSPLPPLTHGELYANSTMLYTALYNLLGVPAGVVPVTQVRPGEEGHRPVSRDPVEQCCRRVDAGSAGLPIGVQVIARWWRE
ncbi:MAG: hypothetical protein KDA63_08185, partial [Planctomycetales bacterium]|nr:hypothetical protein [Planctomycetales bacterium]